MNNFGSISNGVLFELKRAFNHPGNKPEDYSYYDFGWRETDKPPSTMRTVIVDLTRNAFETAVYVNGKWFGFCPIEWDPFHPKGKGHWETANVNLYEIQPEWIRRWKDLPQYDDHPVP